MSTDWTRRRILAGGTALGVGLAQPGLIRAQDMGDLLLSRHTDPGAPPIAHPDDLVPGDGITVTKGLARSRAVAMTFDDGPHGVNTPRLLDMLKKRKIVATFYVIGALVLRYPDIVRRMVDEGHEIGNHTWRHPNLAGLGDDRLFEEIDRTQDAVDKVIKAAPPTMRPPYGALTSRQRNMLHRRRDLPTVLWSVDTSDWKRPGSAVITRRVLTGAHAGAIVLMHDIHKPTIDAMPAALDGLLDRGFRFQTVSQILGHKTWGPGPDLTPLDVDLM